MKWALIYLLGTSGIWDTGYRYEDFVDCFDAASKSGTTLVKQGQRLNKFADHMLKTKQMTLGDAEQLKRSYRNDLIRFRAELRSEFRCMPSKD